MEITRNDALKILEEEGIQGRVLKHVLKVNQIAMFIGKELDSKGIKINLTLLDVSSLLHDVGKKLSDETNIDHAICGVNIMKKRGFKDIARIIGKHAINSVIDKDNAPETWEEKIVYYSDKRVKEDQLVSLDIRMEYLKKRYPEKLKQFYEIVDKIKEIEDEIFNIIKIEKSLEILK